MNGQTDTIVSSTEAPIGSDAAQTPGTALSTDGATENASAPRAGDLAKAFQAGIGEAVGLLMRDPKWRFLSLTDLEWLLFPALASNQMMTLRGKVKDKGGLTVPLALVLWAKVSENVDQKLEAQKKAGAPLRLAPADWTSGDIPWLVLSVGPKELRKKLENEVKNSLNVKIKYLQKKSKITI